MKLYIGWMEDKHMISSYLSSFKDSSSECLEEDVEEDDERTSLPNPK